MGLNMTGWYYRQCTLVTEPCAVESGNMVEIFGSQGLGIVGTYCKYPIIALAIFRDARSHKHLDNLLITVKTSELFCRNIFVKISVLICP